MTQKFTPGMKAFLLIWFGQLVSLLGTGMTNFALGVWVFQHTGSVSAFGIVLLCASLPGVLASPFAGALVDRYSRRTALILSDAAAGSASVCLALLLFGGHLAVWHVCVIVAVSSAFTALQMPALIATTTLLVPKEHFGRASGLMQVAQAASLVISPGLAGVLILVFKLGSILVVDAATYAFAVVTLILVRIPFTPRSEAEEQKASLLSEVVAGWKYMAPRPGLLDLLIVLAITNLIAGYTNVLLTPLVLGFASPRVLGLILSAGGIGFLLGSIGLSAWGGPQRRINGILGLGLVQGGCVLIAGLRPSALLIGAASFAIMLLLPMISGCNQVLWQIKTAPEVQGRVFAVRRAVANSMVPLAYLTAGPLAQRVFDPLFVTESRNASTLRAIVGQGPGRSIGLMFIVMGLLYMTVMILAYLRPRLKNIESVLPDCVPGSLEPAPQAVEASSGR